MDEKVTPISPDTATPESAAPEGAKPALTLDTDAIAQALADKASAEGITDTEGLENRLNEASPLPMIPDSHRGFRGQFGKCALAESTGRC